MFSGQGGSGVGLATGFVFATGFGAVGFIDQDVIAAAGANQAVDGFGELIVGGFCRVFAAGLLAGHGHGLAPCSTIVTK
jgi:hypothetical protein